MPFTIIDAHDRIGNFAALRHAVGADKRKVYLCLETVQKLLVTRTPYKCSSAKKKIAGIGGKGIKGDAADGHLDMPASQKLAWHCHE